MLENGYIKIYRSMLGWEWYQDGNTTRVFLHLILTANHESQKWRGIEIRRGQRIASYRIIADELRLSVQNVRTAIKHLISTGEVTHITTSEYGLFTVNNYDRFQVLTPRPTDGQQSANSQLTPDQQQRKKDKKANKAKESNKYTPALPGVDVFDSSSDQFDENYDHCIPPFEMFWEAYPRKDDRGQAYKKYQTQLNNGWSEAELLAAAKAYSDQCQRDRIERRYIKQAKTFLGDSMPFTDFLPKQNAPSQEMVDPFEQAARELDEAMIKK